MHPTSSFGLLAILPFVAALPVTPEVEARSPQLLEKPAFFKQDAQFDFQPFALTNLDLGCNRKTPDEKFSCKFQCEYTRPVPFLPPPKFPSLVSSVYFGGLMPCDQSTGRTPTRSSKTT